MWYSSAGRASHRDYAHQAARIRASVLTMLRSEPPRRLNLMTRNLTMRLATTPPAQRLLGRQLQLHS